MQIFGVNLQRISLGALIIALGMLVDNAIVVTEGYIIKTRKGIRSEQAARDAVKETLWPLLGATIIAILAFAAISLSKDVTGEFLGSLFKVIALALGLSWLLAITIVPYLCVAFIPDRGETTQKDMYDNFFFRGYKSFLSGCIRYRWVTMLTVVAMLGAAIYGFGFVKQNFFPGSTRPQFIVDLTHPEGTHISTTEGETKKVAQYLSSLEGVTDVTTFTGSGALRFVLTYTPEMPNSAYSQLLVSVDDYRIIDGLTHGIRHYLNEQHPNAITKVENSGWVLGARRLKRDFPDPTVRCCEVLASRRCTLCGPMIVLDLLPPIGVSGLRQPLSEWPRLEPARPAYSGQRLRKGFQQTFPAA